MCLGCAAVAAPEVAAIVGGYAAVRFGRPVSRLRAALGRGDGIDADPSVSEADRPAAADAPRQDPRPLTGSVAR